MRDDVTEAELLEWERNTLIARPEELDRDSYPYMDSISSAFFYRFIPVPVARGGTPEYVYVDDPADVARRHKGDDRARYQLFVTSWNNVWEAGIERRYFFKDEEVPPELRWVLDLEADIRLIPRGRRQRYDSYAPLYHLLPASTLDRFGLPKFRRGIWPHYQVADRRSRFLPADFNTRFEKAFSYHLWPLLGARSAPTAFSGIEPVRLLSHNLDFWLPYIDQVAQEIARSKGRVPCEDDEQARILMEAREKIPEDQPFVIERPLFGGELWSGEDVAWEATERMVELADSQGQLRGILEAVRGHRLEDDFSAKWSYEREDFERRLHRKRNKIKVSFVELDETVPVHGPDSEVHENLLWEDFFALLNEKEREVVVCLRSGYTKVGDIAQKLGYANHSPVSKRLRQIRKKVERFLG